jgi:hypothetical protein
MNYRANLGKWIKHCKVKQIPTNELVSLLNIHKLCYLFISALKAFYLKIITAKLDKMFCLKDNVSDLQYWVIGFLRLVSSDVMEWISL